MGVHGLQAYVEAKRGGGSDAPRPVDLGQVAAALPAKDGALPPPTSTGAKTDLVHLTVWSQAEPRCAWMGRDCSTGYTSTHSPCPTYLADPTNNIL
jgi:hypothetical protein